MADPYRPITSMGLAHDLQEVKLGLRGKADGLKTQKWPRPIEITPYLKIGVGATSTT